MKKETSLWLTSYLTKKPFANARETVMRGWIICLKICKYIRITSPSHNTLVLYSVRRSNDSFCFCDFRYDYKIAREYNWNVKNKASKGYEENYFFIFRDGDGVYYNELETR